MKACILTFHALTAAQKGETTLRKNKIETEVTRTPKWMAEQGCGNALRVNCRDIYRAIGILKENNITYRKAYLRNESGRIEELTI